MLRGGRGQPLEPGELTLRRLAHVLGERDRLQPLAKLLDLGALGVALAELVLDRLHLLAQEELALPLLHLRLDLRLDPRPELEDLELAVQDARDVPEPLLDAHVLEQLLLLLGLQAQRRRDEMAERARVVDVRGSELQLLGQVRDERDDAREQRLHVAGQRLDLGRLLEHVRHLDEAPDEIWLDLRGLLEPDPAEALHEDAQRPVGDADHLVDHGRGPDLVEVLELWLLVVRVARGQEREHPVAADDVVDELDRALLADRERRHRLREDDGVAQGEHGELLRDRDDVGLDRRGLQLGLELAHPIRLIAIVNRAGAGALLGDGQDDSEQPAFVGRRGAARIDVERERHLALERSVLDLAAVPDLVGRAGSRPFAGNDEPTFVEHDPDRVGVGAGDLDDDGELGRVIGANDVDLRPVHEPGARGEPRHLPEVGEELLELGQPVDVAPSCHLSQRRVPRRAPVRCVF